MDESRNKDGVKPSGELRYRENRDAPAMRSRDDFHPGEVPATPGIYIFRDRFSKVIYVGKAANLRKRVSSYFQPSRQLTADPKLRSLINSIAFYETHAVKTESESLLYESKMIKEYAPRYNVLLRDDKRFLLVKINLSEKFPVLKLARLRKNDGHTYFGPFPKGGALKRTVEFLVRKFELRICSSAVPGERDRKHCLAGIVKDCCEPCVGKATEEDYKSRIEKLTHIINGNVSEIVSEIRELMAEAVELRRFEKAAVYRDVIENIETIFGKKNRNFRYARIPEEKNAEEALEALREVLGLAEPPRIIEAFDISNISGSLAVASMVRFTNGRPDTAKYRRFRIRGETGEVEAEKRRNGEEEMGKGGARKCSSRAERRIMMISNDQYSISNEEVSGGKGRSEEMQKDYPLGCGGDDFAMMEEAVFRRYSRVKNSLIASEASISDVNNKTPQSVDQNSDATTVSSETMPDLIVIDGGKGQLNAALKAIVRSGAPLTPVIGLAKRNEEIFTPGRQLPIRLDMRNPAVNLLRAVRDEAHRFAVAYHRKLRNSRIEESILDQISGIGPERKRKLLRAFASVSALRKASQEEICAKVPGIGTKFAETLVEYFSSNRP